jgi:hypothetical protein
VFQQFMSATWVTLVSSGLTLVLDLLLDVAKMAGRAHGQRRSARLGALWPVQSGKTGDVLPCCRALNFG